MFLLTEIKYFLMRNKIRAILLACIIVLLMSCMGAYLGNIYSISEAISDLGETVPVKAKIVSTNGSRTGGIFINAVYVDKLLQEDIREIECTSMAAGAFSADAKGESPFVGGDTEIMGANSLKATGISEQYFTFAENLETDFLESSKNYCAVDEEYAMIHQISVGDQISMPIYLLPAGMGYEKISDSATLQVAATFSSEAMKGQGASIIVPVRWLRNQTAEYGLNFFCYDSFKFVVNKPVTNLNHLKASLREIGFLPVDSSRTGISLTGESGLIDDKMFISTAGKLQDSLRIYQQFLIPFFLVLVCLLTLSIFLALKNNQRDMAISISLGRSKLFGFMSIYLAVFLLCLIGSGMAFPIILFLFDLSVIASLITCAVFLLCSIISTALALMVLLRFDALVLLTKID